jgi:tRNA(Arg) A34 adenosine deaminase TadA
VRHPYPRLVISLPEWVPAFMAASPASLATLEERMRLAISLARENVNHGGGPFGAILVETEGGRVVAPGVNLVVPLSCSLAHAEIVAIAIAQQMAGSYDLGAPGLPALQLVTSTEPCAMCLGAIPWSGIRSLVCGAGGEDAERIGFDEGDKPERWPETLAGRGISVLRGICGEEAAGVLAHYARSGGPIYNGSIRADSRDRSNAVGSEPHPAPLAQTSNGPE